MKLTGNAQIKVDDKGLAPLKSIASKVQNTHGLLATTGRATANRIKRHLRDFNASHPNKLGAKRTNFYANIADTVFLGSPFASKGQIKVGIGHVAIAQKVFGGTIKAKRTKYLTIPLTARAYDRTARTYAAETGETLFAVTSRKGNKLLAHSDGQGGLLPVYLLRSSVNQDPTPGVLPDDKELSNEILKAAQAFAAAEPAIN